MYSTQKERSMRGGEKLVGGLLNFRDKNGESVDVEIDVLGSLRNLDIVIGDLNNQIQLLKKRVTDLEGGRK